MSEPTFNPAYPVGRCGQQGNHSPHVVDYGPDQPRNCPGTGPTFGEEFAEALRAAKPCCPEFAATGYAHTEICPAFETNDPANRAAGHPARHTPGDNQ